MAKHLELMREAVAEGRCDRHRELLQARLWTTMQVLAHYVKRC